MSLTVNGDEKCKILFLCTGNSARSILAEYLLRAMDPRFAVYSAGAQPTGKVHPMALSVLREAYGVDARGARSKSLRELDGIDFDVVITVCDHARDSCPVPPGTTAIHAHWSSPDPARSGAEAERAFRRVARQIHHRLKLFCGLPFASGPFAADGLGKRIRDIGREHPPATGT